MAYDLGLADRVRTILGRITEFDERKMFGGLSFMVNGHMCCGVVKTDLVLRPLLEILKERQWLADNWRAYLQSALMCCPLLTMNLCDEVKFPPKVSLLGFAHAIQMGHDPLC